MSNTKHAYSIFENRDLWSHSSTHTVFVDGVAVRTFNTFFEALDWVHTQPV